MASEIENELSGFPVEPCNPANWRSTTGEQVAAAIELLAQFECPWAKLMREQGCDPKDGWVLMLPKGLLDIKQLPEYVKESEFVFSPMCINTRTA